VRAIDEALLGPGFEQEADRLTGAVVRDGNSVTLMPSGVQSYAKRWELIEGAETSVHMVSFSFMKDDTTRRLAALAADKVRHGVEVKMIVDDAALYTTFSRGILEGMARNGVEVLTYNSPLHYLSLRRMIRHAKLALKRRFHEKYMVVDGRQAILGGMNWGTKYALGGTDPKWWRDTDVHLTGPVVADIQRRFLTDVFVYRAQDEAWKHRHDKGFDPVAQMEQARKQAEAFMQAHATEYFPTLDTTGPARIRYVPHKPWDESTLPLTNGLLQLIRSARQSIYWGCHGVRPPRMIAENLADAAARGVDVHLITNSKKSSRSLMGHGLMGWMYWECSHYFHWLVEHGIHVHEWQLPGAFHSKNIVVDDTVAAVGSYNVANGSCFHHSESSVIVIGGDFPAAVRQQFEVDLENCQELALDKTKRYLVPLGFFDPWRRPLHERNLLVDRSVWPAKVAADIDAGKVVWKYSDKPAT
jgi:phosphatidylserine/phosphatidylglycerophosphate/cardiolipin synthase-like enzyme